MVFIKTRILPPIRADTTDEGGESLLHKKWLKMENLDSRKITGKDLFWRVLKMYLKRNNINKCLSVLLSILLILGSLVLQPTVAYATDLHADHGHALHDCSTHEHELEAWAEKMLPEKSIEEDARTEEVFAKGSDFLYFASDVTVEANRLVDNGFVWALRSSEDESPHICVSNATGYAGKEVTLTASLENNPGIAVYALTMKYPEELIFVRAEKGDILTGFFDAYSVTEGQVSIIAASSDGDDVVTGSILFTITFMIKAGTPNGTIVGLDLGFHREGDQIGNQNYERLNDAFSFTQGIITVPEEEVCEHFEVSQHKDPTCVVDGYDRVVCAICKEVLRSTPILAYGAHNEDDLERGSRAPTCVAPGFNNA